jgi:prepilin-type N-terminal cleavage/methylation domain-containing protein
MKPMSDNSSQPPPARLNLARAFTLAEMMTTLAIFSLVVIAMVSLQIFGLKVNAITSSKLESTAYSLKVLDQVRDLVCEASSVSVGNGNSTSFTATDTSGNALQVYPTTNSNYLRFYLATNTTALYELNSTNPNLSLLASNVVNKTVFEAVNFQGNLLSGDQEHYAIQLTLQFAQLAYTVPSNTYDYYTLQTEMTPRTQ